MASPLHRLIPWLRRPVRTCLRSIPISRPWQQGLLYPICTRLMAREGGEDGAMGLGYWCSFFALIFIADGDDAVIELINISCSKKIMAYLDMCLKKQKATSRKHFDQDSFFRTSFHLKILFFFTWVGQETVVFLGNSPALPGRRIWSISRNTSDSFYETCKLLFSYTDPQGRPAGLLSQEWRGFRQLQRDFFKHFSSWSDVTGENHELCIAFGSKLAPNLAMFSVVESKQ